MFSKKHLHCILSFTGVLLFSLVIRIGLKPDCIQFFSDLTAQLGGWLNCQELCLRTFYKVHSHIYILEVRIIFGWIRYGCKMNSEGNELKISFKGMFLGDCFKVCGVKCSVWFVELNISFYTLARVYQEVRWLQHFIHTGPQCA